MGCLGNVVLFLFHGIGDTSVFKGFQAVGHHHVDEFIHRQGIQGVFLREGKIQISEFNVTGEVVTVNTK